MMRKGFLDSRRGSFFLLGFLVLLSFFPPSPAEAVALSYSTGLRQIKACILIADPTEGPVAPYLFYLLDNRIDLKPPGWEFVNPLAPSRVDSWMLQRWNQSPLSTVPTRENPYVEGQKVTKDMAVYWEVFLSRVSAEDLARFDIIYLAGLRPGVFRFQEEDRDKLRKAVDAGAILWLEDGSGNWGIDGSTLFFGATFGLGGPVGKSVRIVQPFHPLLNRPYTVTPSEIREMVGSNIRSIQTTRSLDLAGLSALNPPAGLLTPLVKTETGQLFIATAPYGAGHIVMLGTPLGYRMNAAVRQGRQTLWTEGNRGAFSGTDFSSVPPSALKLAYNLISLGNDSPQERATSHHRGSQPEATAVPMVRKWSFPSPGLTAQDIDPVVSGGEWDPSTVAPNSSAPAVFKGVLFVAAANGYLYAFDLDPNRDLDGDGNPDDGTPSQTATQRLNDFSLGAPYDIIWSYNLGAQVGQTSGGTRLISSPVLATIHHPDPTRGTIDVLYVLTEDGKLWAFDAFPTTFSAEGGLRLAAEGKLLWQQTVSAPFPAIPRLPIRIPAPLFVNGRLFVAGIDPRQPNQGIVREVDPATGQILWSYARSEKPMASGAPGLGQVVATPSAGWVRDPNSGAMDFVLYVPTRADPQQGQTGRIFSFLLSVRGERLQDSGDHQNFRSRFWVSPNNFPWKSGRVYLRPSNRTITWQMDPGRPGIIRLSEPVDPSVYQVYADYELDPRADQYKPRSVFYGFPGANGQYPDFIASPVIGPDDTVYAVATDLNRNLSTLYAMREESPVAFVKWRYSLPGVTIVGSPAFLKDKLYVVTREGRLLGFDTQATFRIDLNGLIDLGRKFQIQLLQRDPMLPANYGSISFTFNPAQFDADNITEFDPRTGVARQHGRILVKAFSLSGSSALDAAQPVTVRYPVVGGTGMAEETLEITTTTQRCSLQLFPAAGGLKQANKIFDVQTPAGLGSGVVTSPTLSGEVLLIPTGDGNIAAYPSDPCLLEGRGGVAGSSLQPISATIPLSRQLMVGISGPVPLFAPVVIVDGNLIVNSAGGIHVFHQPISLVADANRLVELRSSLSSATLGLLGGSEVLWTLSTTRRLHAWPKPGVGQPPTPIQVLPEPVVTPFSHPSVALRLSNTDFLVADTGNHRVVEVDRAGTVLWELTDFADPCGLLAGGEPLTLNSPTDVQRWTAPLQNAKGEVIGTEIHTLVVDSGNHRILEIRDTINLVDPSRSEYHVLIWASRTNIGEKQYEYRNAQRLPTGETIATVLNWRVNSVDGSIPDTPGSSIVVLSGPRLGPDQRPLLDPTGCLVDPGGKIVAFMNSLILPDKSVKPIENPVYFQRFFSGRGAKEWTALLADGRGVYDLVGQPGERGEIKLLVRGAIIGPEAVGVVSAKRLANGNTLIVNKALSAIYEFDPKAPPGQQFILISPVTSGTFALVHPSYADRGY